MTIKDALHHARSAAESAPSFVDVLCARYSSIADHLRRGNDADALMDLGASTEELHSFLEFLILTGECMRPLDPDAATALATYQDRLVETLESIQPALGHRDLVEVADALEDDLVPVLQEYRGLDDVVRDALTPAPAASAG